MAISFDALLRIKADVQGEGAIQGLGAKLTGLQTTAGNASTGFKGLAEKVGGLAPALQALVPMATGAGLVALATNAINAADNLNDMRQKTGVSVERLSQLQQAAEKSGITIDDVSRALVKYNKGIVDGKAGEALDELGISAKNASGEFKTADEVLLEVADKFASMPDGAEKTAAAIKLFGRAGADMIPMLNGGSESIKGLAVTMTGDFAKAADEFNDKMVDLRTGLVKVGVNLGTALMPILLASTDAILGIVGAVSSLPEPMQNVVGGAALLGVALLALAPAISAVISIIGLLAAGLASLQIGATIAGWAAVAGPAITTISAAFTGFLAFLTSTILPGLLAFFSGPVGWTVLAVGAVIAMAFAFREPIGKFLAWLSTDVWPVIIGGFNRFVVDPLKAAWSAAVQFLSTQATTAANALSTVWTSISKGFISYLIKPIEAAWGAVVKFLSSQVTSATNTIASAWASISASFTRNLITPLRSAWTAVVGFLSAELQKARESTGAVWTAIAATFTANIVTPIRNAWTALTASLPAAMQSARGLITGAWNGISKNFSDYVVAPVQAAWTKVANFLPAALNSAAAIVKSVWTNVVDSIKAAFSGFLQGIANSINGAIKGVNILISAFNKLPGSDIKLVPALSIPKFAEGGFVTRPTLAEIGEGGEPEYVVPQSKAMTFANNIAAGRTGASALARGGSTGTTSAPRAPVVNITTGPVRQVGNEQLVTLADLESAVRQATRQVYATLRTPEGRRALGVA